MLEEENKEEKKRREGERERERRRNLETVQTEKNIIYVFAAICNITKYASYLPCINPSCATPRIHCLWII
jgi:hypothetical protein